MLRQSAGLVAVFGVCFVIGSYVNTALGRHATASEATATTAALVIDRAAKGARLADARPAPAPNAAVTVEVVGLDGATVILRDRAGEVVYKADALRNTTVVSRDVDIPTITVKDKVDSPAATRPTEAPARRSRKPATAGCDGTVSSLVNSEFTRVPSLCLT